jgi:hypothetical protein
MEPEKIDIFTVVRLGDEEALRRIVRQYKEKILTGGDVSTPTFFSKITSMFYTDQDIKVSCSMCY